MIIRYLSDLHLEFGNLKQDPDPADVLILAGDITIKNRVDWINSQVSRFGLVIYIFGNHEFYRQNLDNTYTYTRSYLDPKVSLLNNESITYNGQTFHGCTLWSDYENGNPLSYMYSSGSINDYRLIRADNGISRFSPQRAHQEHMISKLFLKDNVKPGDVVVTHHAPSWQSVHEKYKHEKNNGAYVSDLSDLIQETKPKYWIHGHTHSTFNYKVHETTVLCNPRGYDRIELNEDFDVNAYFIV